MELKAREDGCEEASVFSQNVYIPCNAPAEFVVRHSEGDYRMCAMCTDHNIRNRGAVLIGPYQRKEESGT